MDERFIAKLNIKNYIRSLKKNYFLNEGEHDTNGIIISSNNNNDGVYGQSL